MSFKLKDPHWEMIISFLENNKDMAMGRFFGPEGKHQIKRLWQDLAASLNSLGLGERSPEKWQKVVNIYNVKIDFLCSSFFIVLG